MTDRFIAMLALERPAQLKSDAVIVQLRAQNPSEKIEAAGGPAPPGGAFILRLGQELVTVMQIDAPLPAGTLDRAITGDLFWPDAGRILAGHRAHVIVASLQDPQDLPGRIVAATSVTRVCTAIAALSPALGVYWVPSEAIYEAHRFLAIARAPEAERPVDLWLRLHFIIDKTKSLKPLAGCTTSGLTAFVGREIEFRPADLPPPIVAQRVLGTAHYLLTNGPVLKHGDTLGISATERILVEHVDKGEWISAPIMRLTYQVN